MNKKIVLSVLSTAVVASMASSAFAAPSAGLYLGGDAKKFYSQDALLSLSASAKTTFTSLISQFVADSALNQVVYVNLKGEGADVKEMIDKGYTEAIKDPLKAADFVDSYTEVKADGTAGATVDPKKEFPTTGGDLKVESVSAITKTGVEIKFEALAEAKTGVTVEVKDNNGNTVPVVAQDLAKGETSASFDFVTALTVDPTGVWTVEGKTYDFGAVKQFNDIVAAALSGNEINTLAALKAAGLTDIKDENITAYVQAINASTTKETLADIQAIIKKANEDSISAGDAAAAVKAVNDATTQPQLLTALQNKAFARVNASWIVEYQTAINTAKATPANTDTVAEIQALVDGVNNTEIGDADTAATTSTEQNNVTALIQAYVADDVAPATTKADAIKASQVKAGVFKVKEATTQTTVYSALTGLAALDSANLPAASLNASLKADYLTAQVAYKGTITGATTVAQIKTNIVDAADTAALTAALTGVDALIATSTDADVKAALQKLANVTSHKSGSNKFDITTVKDANLNKYVTDATVGFIAVEAGGVTLAEVQTAITNVNADAGVGAALDTVNNASSTAADVRAALIDIAVAQADVGSQTAVDAFISLTTQAQLEVAQLVIDNRPAAPGYANIDAIMNDADGTGAIATQQAAHAAKVAEFNAIGNLATATTADIKADLDTYAYAGYVNLTNTQKVSVAQEIGKLTKSVSGTPTPLDFSGADAVKSFKEANDIIDAAKAAAGI